MADQPFEQRCRTFFKDADVNGSGCLSKLELAKCVQNAGMKKDAEEIVSWFDELDVNDDDQISEAEFVKALTKVDMKDVRDADLRSVFNSIDTDKSGYIDINELRKALEKMGVDPSTADLGNDEDGKVNYEEFLVMLKDQ